ncbi:MAG: nucleotidyltransferase domain-containing protein [Fimbriimonadaceae bacterium]|nr:nucleotidyltransferase domain-containing protein [Fimbriimonadaceae bacterium]
MTQDLNATVAEMVRVVRAAVPEAVALYRFGSFGTDWFGPESDLDIGVVMPFNQPMASPFDLDVPDIDGHFLDIVDLYEAPITLQLQVIEHGHRMWAERPSEFGWYEVFVMREYQDWYAQWGPYMKRCAERGYVLR